MPTSWRPFYPDLHFCPGRRYRISACLRHSRRGTPSASSITRTSPGSSSPRSPARGADDAAELVFRIFRRQQLEKFLPGLEKLGLRGLPDAVACAQYHYLSNDLGGVRVEYMPESDRKAWVRYVPPRWIYHGATICAVPSEVTRAILRGWHANNGVLLGNPPARLRLHEDDDRRRAGARGVLPRSTTARSRPRSGSASHRTRTGRTSIPRARRGSTAATWPPERLAKAMRNYAMTYVRTMLLELADLFGADEARRLGGITGRLIGMQLLRPDRGAPRREADGLAQAFADYLTQIGVAQGDDTTWTRDGDGVVVRQPSWRLIGGAPDVSPAVFDAWNELWVGALSIHDRRAQAARGAAAERARHGDRLADRAWPARVGAVRGARVYRRLSDSPLWAANRRYYDRTGIDAWRSGDRPPLRHQQRGARDGVRARRARVPA